MLPRPLQHTLAAAARRGYGRADFSTHFRSP